MTQSIIRLILKINNSWKSTNQSGGLISTEDMAQIEGRELKQGNDMLQTLIPITKTGAVTTGETIMIAKYAIKRGETMHLILVAKAIEIEEEKGEGLDPIREAQEVIRMIKKRTLTKGK